jgi:hypothetical protein
MLIRREKIRQDQQELRGRRHREARERLMEMRARRTLSGHHYGPYGVEEPRKLYILDDDSLIALPENITYRHYQIWVVLRQALKPLFDEWKKRMTIRSCKAIKEELMMNRWHPDRVEKMVEAGTLEDLW